MFGKLNTAQLYSQLKSLKKSGKRGIATLGKHYQTIKDGLNALDRGMNVAKSVYEDVKPNIQQLAGDKPIQHINKGIDSYDQIRNRVVDTHSQAEKHTAAVTGALKKQGINIGI